jgi:hypothetical protein
VAALLLVLWLLVHRHGCLHARLLLHLHVCWHGLMLLLHHCWLLHHPSSRVHAVLSRVHVLLCWHRLLHEGLLHGWIIGLVHGRVKGLRVLRVLLLLLLVLQGGVVQLLCKLLHGFLHLHAVLLGDRSVHRCRVLLLLLPCRFLLLHPLSRSCRAATCCLLGLLGVQEPAIHPPCTEAALHPRKTDIALHYC